MCFYFLQSFPVRCLLSLLFVKIEVQGVCLNKLFEKIIQFLYNNKKGAMKFTNYLIILFFNYIMLGFGYAGEVGWMQKELANVLGFGGFAALYYFIYKKYIAGRNNKDNNLLFAAFVILWAFYGVFYMFDEVTRNVGYNILDLLSKCFVGIFFWAYYTNVFKI